MHSTTVYRYLTLSAVIIAIVAVSFTSALEIDDDAIDKAVGKAQELLRSRNMTVQLTDEQAMEVKEKLGRMAKQFGPLLAGGLGGGGFGGVGGGLESSKLLTLLIFALLRGRGGFGGGFGGFGGNFGGNNDDNGGNQVILVPSQQAPAQPAPAAPATPAVPATPATSPFDLISLITLLGLLLLLISLLPTGF